MKSILLFIAMLFISCSTDEISQPKEVIFTGDCYKIISVGSDSDGGFLILKTGQFTSERYNVSNYNDYLRKSEICNIKL